MELIREYAMNIIVVILFSVSLEMIMPGSSFKKYIKLVVGLLIMFVMVKPLVDIPSLKDIAISYPFPKQVQSKQSEQVYKHTEEIQDNLIKMQFSQSLSDEIKDAIYEKFGTACRVSAGFDGKQITVYIAGDEEKRQEIEKFVHAEYAVSVTPNSP